MRDKEENPENWDCASESPAKQLDKTPCLSREKMRAGMDRRVVHIRIRRRHGYVVTISTWITLLCFLAYLSLSLLGEAAYVEKKKERQMPEG